MKKQILFLTLAAMFSFSSSAVFAQKANQNNANDSKQKECPVSQCCKDFGFTDDQKKQMKDLKFKQDKQLLPIENQIKEKKAHLQTLRTADKADMNEINKTVEEIGKLKIEKMKIREAGIQDFRKILTDEQRLRFDTQRKNFKGKHHGGQHHGNPHHGQYGQQNQHNHNGQQHHQNGQNDGQNNQNGKK